jgi:hypothetical protein
MLENMELHQLHKLMIFGDGTHSKEGRPPTLHTWLLHKNPSVGEDGGNPKGHTKKRDGVSSTLLQKKLKKSEKKWVWTFASTMAHGPCTLDVCIT